MRLNCLFKSPFSGFKKRNVVFDLLKLFAALMVILDHSLQRWIEGSQSTQLYNFIFLTQMPLFVFIAGFFIAKKNNNVKTLAEYAFTTCKTAASLLIPFCSYSLITTAFEASSFSEYWTRVFNCFLNPQTSLWFLWALFCLEFFILTSFFLANLFRIKNRFCYLTIALVLFLFFIGVLAFLFLKITSFFDLKLIVYYSIYFIFGILCFSLKETKLLSFRNVEWCRIAIIMVCLTILVVAMIFHPTFINDQETFLNLAIRVCSSLCSICICYFVFYYIGRIKLTRNVSVFGSLSLEMYYTHLLFFSIMPFFKSKLAYSLGANALAFIGLYTATIGITILLILLFKSFVVTDLILYGKTIPLTQRNSKNS